MNPVSIDFQKKLVYIPMLNISCVFICVYNFLVHKKGSGFTPFLIMVLSYLPFFVLAQITSDSLPKLSYIISLLNGYVPMVLSGILLIKYQEKLGFE